jgi:putative transposase
MKLSSDHPRHQNPRQLRTMIQNIHVSTGHSVRLICQTLDLPRSSYHHAAVPCARQLSDAELRPRIEAVFREHQRRYGYRRIYHLLRAEGITVSPDRVRRLMREAAFIALQPKTYVPQTSDGRADKPSDNLLQGRPLPTKPNEVWAGDICFATLTLRAACGWLSRYARLSAGLYVATCAVI